MFRFRKNIWELVGGHEIALWGALEGKPGISLVAGTGSICCGRNAEGDTLRAGGWGHLIGDEGSGYAIGRDVIKAVSHLWDGYGAPTCLAELLAEQAAAGGDAVALQILQDNACQVSCQVAAVVNGFHMEQGEVALLGGLLENDTVYRKFVVEEIEKSCPGFRCVAPRQNAAVGAVMMAQNLLEK